MAGNLLQRLNESVTLKWTTGLFMCTSSSSATVAVAVALCPAHSTEHTARSSRRSLMRRNGRNRKKCSMLLSELGAVFEPRYLCALIYHLSRVPHTLDTLQNRWSLYIYTRTHLCVQSQAKSSFRSLIKVKTVTRCDSASKQKTSGLRRKCVRGKWRCST